MLRPHLARSALRALVAISSLGALWALEHAAYAQAGAEKAGAGGAPAAGAQKGASGGGQEGAEKSGSGGGAPAADKPAPPSAETKVVIYVEGAKAAEVRTEIEMALPVGVTIVPAGPFVESLRKQGLLPLAKSLKGPAERQEAAPKVQAAVRESGAQAAIVANAPAAKGGKYDIPLLIVPFDNATPLASTNAKAPAKGGAGAQPRAEAIAGFVSPAISGIVPIVSAGPEPKAEEPKAEEPKAEEPKAEEPKAEEPKAEEPKAEEKKPEPAPTNNFVRGKYLLEAGIGTQGRSFFYIFPSGLERGDNIRSYDLLAAPHLSVRGDVYPFAGPGDSFANGIGLTAAVGGAFGLTSNFSDLNDVETTFFHFRIGPKLRFPLGVGPNPALLTGEVSYSRLAFTFTDPNGVTPSFIYQSIRPGVGLRLPAGPVALLVEGGYHFVNDSGALGDRFPNASVFGLDAQLGLAVPITDALEGRFNLNYTRYRGNLQADLDSPTGYIAAGSVDQFFGLRVGVAIAP
ncbi:MAG TPA: hypothetical protein VFS43_12185 [Polyangiaceae bacterium]|nr:hypothetical protein [Polyangiaceae bacterium]